MDAAQKSFELQAKVRQNAEAVKNTLNDLYNWEKEIKDKERKIQQSQVDDNKEKENSTFPVRSHIKDLDSKKLLVDSAAATPVNPLNNGLKYNSLMSPSSEKQDSPNDPLELKHKEANEIKDRGNKYVKLSKYIEAIAAYTQAIQLYNKDAVYYSNRALCYLRLERYEECIEDCDQAILIDNSAVKAYYRRMLANEALGNNMDALKDCSTILILEPKNGEAKRCLDRINERLRKNAQVTPGPNFTPLRSDLVDILPIDKPAYKRSTKPLKRIAIADVVSSKESKNYENLTISDDDIDKLFNSNCGHIEEIKETVNKNHNVQTPTKVHNKTLNENVNKPFEHEEKEKETQSNLNNKIYSKKIELECEDKKERPLPPAPTSTGQFYSNWKELTPSQKYQYLKSIPLRQICKILGAGFDSDTLTDVINTLHDYYLLDNHADVANVLFEVSKNKQVSLLSLLMSAEERNVLEKVINSLKETNSLNTAAAEQITKNFNLNY